MPAKVWFRKMKCLGFDFGRVASRFFLAALDGSCISVKLIGYIYIYIYIYTPTPGSGLGKN